MRRRTVLATAVGVLTAPRLARTVTWPLRAVRIVVPTSTGRGPDLHARMVAAHLQARLGVPLVVENRPGSGHASAAPAAMAARMTDGHVLFAATTASHAINPALYADPGFDAARDYEPVAFLAAAPHVLLAHPGLVPPALGDLAALLRAARASGDPRALAYAHPGEGTPEHLSAALLLAARAGLPSTEAVPRRGVGPALNEVAAGLVPLAMAEVGDALPLLRVGRVRAVGVAAPERSAALPEVPTLDESRALPGPFAAASWTALVAPRGTLPAPVVARLNALVAEALALPEVAARRAELASGGSAPMDPDALRRFLTAEATTWAEAVRASGLPRLTE